MKWNDISTLPKDGTDVILKTHIGIVSAWYHSEDDEWVCYDDMFVITGDDVTIEGWLPFNMED